MPLRREIADLDRAARRAEARAELGLDADAPVLLVTGGSLGAERLNRTAVASAEAVLAAGWQVLHLAGGAHRGAGPAAARLPDAALRATGWTSCCPPPTSPSPGPAPRPSASSPRSACPRSTCPYAVGNGEQRFNAAGVVAAGGAILVPDAEFTPETFARVVLPLLADPDRIARMAAAAGGDGVRDGAERMARLARGVLPAGRPRRVPRMTIKPDLTVPIPDRLDRVHFVGVGGAGMSGIARLFLARGATVSGSDRGRNANTDMLRDLGATISIGHAAEHVGDVDAVVVTSALWPDNPELAEARRRGIPVLHRSHALKALIGGDRLVSVAGAHGKTTTTGMLAVALDALGADPSFVDGGVIKDFGASSRIGGGDVFVVEADESDGSFLLYDTAVALVLNVDADHLDHYGTAEAFDDAFVTFGAQASELLVINADDPGARRVRDRVRGQRVRTYGEDAGADVRVSDIRTDGAGRGVLTADGASAHIRLRIAGRHRPCAPPPTSSAAA